MRKLLLAMLVFVCAIGILLPQGMAHAQEGLVWDDVPGEQPADVRDEPAALHLLTSDAVYVSGGGIECICCEHCPICYDQETGERTGAFCKCLDENGNYVSCGCECPFEISILDEDFLEKLNASHYIYDAQGNTLSDRETWYQTYQEAVAPQGQPLRLVEGQTVAMHLESYEEITGLSETGGVFVDCGCACHAALPMTMNAIMPLSSSGPVWYDGSRVGNPSAEKGWICYDWADVQRVLTGTTSNFPSAYANIKAKESGYNQWWYKTDNNVQMRRIFLAVSMTATSNITSATDTGKVQIVAFNPTQVIGYDNMNNRSNWNRLSMGNYKFTGRTGDSFLSLAYGFYTASHTSGYLLQPGTSGKKEMELYHADYNGGPYADTGTTSNSSRVIIDDSTATITAGKFARAVKVDVNPWTLDAYSSIKRNGVAGELIEWVQYGSSGGKLGIEFGEWSGSGTLDIDLGGAGHLFGSSAGTNTRMWMNASTGGRTQAASRADFILRGIGDANIGLLSNGNALKAVNFAAGGSFTVTPPASSVVGQYVGTHASPANGYNFVDVATFSYGAPFDMEIYYSGTADRAALKMNSVFYANANSKMIVRSIGGSASALIAPSMTLIGGSYVEIESKISSAYINNTSPTILLASGSSVALSVPANAELVVLAENGCGEAISATPSLSSLNVAGIMRVTHSLQGSSNPKSTLTVNGGVTVAGTGRLTMMQSPPTGSTPLYNQNVLTASSLTIAQGGVLESSKIGASSAVAQPVGNSLQINGLARIDGNLQIGHNAGTMAISATGGLTVGSTGYVKIQATRLSANDVEVKRIVQSGPLTIAEGGEMYVAAGDNKPIDGEFVYSSGNINISGLLQVQADGPHAFGQGSGVRANNTLTVEPTGKLDVTLRNSRTDRGGITAEEIVLRPGSNVQLTMVTTNTARRAYGMYGVASIVSDGDLTVDYTNMSTAVGSGGPAVVTPSLSVGGIATVNHLVGGANDSTLGDLFAVDVQNTARISGRLMITSNGIAGGLGTPNMTNAMFADKTYVSTGGALTIQSNAGIGLKADTLMQVDGGLFVDKPAGSAFAPAVRSGKTTIQNRGTAEITVGNGSAGLDALGSTVDVITGGKLTMGIQGTGSGTALAANTVTISGAGSNLDIDQSGGATGIQLGTTGNGAMQVRDSATARLFRAPGVASNSTGLVGGTLSIDNAGFDVELTAGQVGINVLSTDSSVPSEVSITGGGNLGIQQDDQSTGTAIIAKQITTSGQSPTRASTLTISQAAANASANAVRLTGAFDVRKGSSVSIEQDAGSHTIWQNGGTADARLVVDATVNVAKYGGSGNVIRTGSIVIGQPSADNAHASLTVNQTAGSGMISMLAPSRAVQAHEKSTLNLGKRTGSTGAVIAAENGSINFISTGASTFVEQEAGDATFSNIESFAQLQPIWFSVVRSAASDRPIFDASAAGQVRLQDPQFTYLTNNGGALMQGTGAGSFNLRTVAANYMTTYENVWNNGWANASNTQFAVQANINGTGTTGIVWPEPSNVLLDNKGVAPAITALDTSTFDVASNVFQFLRAGTFDAFTITQPLKGDTTIRGTTPASVTGANAYEFSMLSDSIIAQTQGPVTIPVSGPYTVTMNALDLNRSQVYVQAFNADGLKAWERADVKGWVGIEADDPLQFRDTNVSYSGVVERATASTDWKLKVTDNRGYSNGGTWVPGSGWRVQVKVAGLLTNVNAPYDTLATSGIFLRRSAMPDMDFTTTNQLFHDQSAGMETGTTEKIFQWPANQGILFKQGFSDGIIGGEYQTLITWTITY